MKINVLGATGMVGSRVVTEAVGRGHQLTATSRRVATHDLPPGATAVAIDVTDIDRPAESLAGSDAVVVAIRPPRGCEATLPGLTDGILKAARTSRTRVLVAGGSGPLRSPHNADLLVLDDTTYVPSAWRPIAKASTDQLQVCRQHHDLDWTYLSPPALLEPGTRTGTYRRGTDTLLTHADGTSRISVEDFAVAIVDELEDPMGTQLFTVAH
jgi:putative NADH-flavin reductase